jgi:Uma2 family endonuclease
MQTRLVELGASASFVAETMMQLIKQGMMPSSCAPDVCVVRDSDFNNRFRLPLWIAEIVSKDTRDYDLYFKAYFYECLGVQEYFVFETGPRSGRLLRSYRLTTEIGGRRYEELPLAGATAWSQTLSLELPMAWKV